MGGTYIYSRDAGWIHMERDKRGAPILDCSLQIPTVFFFFLFDITYVLR
jgi:hypothetical protein